MAGLDVKLLVSIRQLVALAGIDIGFVLMVRGVTRGNSANSGNRY